MNVQLSDKEIIYLYGKLKKELKELENIKPKSMVKADIQLHQSIIESLETAMPQLSMLPL
ncbi:MAG: hypothetical protein K2H85_08840 [Allobaculum sp.]|nr:hypothetical protein [Allobaculum sp.]